MSEHVTKGAMMTCTCGTVPSQLQITSNTFFFIQGNLAATTNDKVAMTNIMPFGTCLLQPVMSGFLPCMPAPAAWTGFAPTVQLETGNLLLQTATIQCATGGLISFQNSGQINPQKVTTGASRVTVESIKKTEDTKNPEILRIYWTDKQESGSRELSELEEGKEVTLCVEVEEGGKGESLDVEISAPQGVRFKNGQTSLKFENLMVGADNIACVENFKIEYDYE